MFFIIKHLDIHCFFYFFIITLFFQVYLECTEYLQQCEQQLWALYPRCAILPSLLTIVFNLTCHIWHWSFPSCTFIFIKHVLLLNISIYILSFVFFITWMHRISPAPTVFLCILSYLCRRMVFFLLLNLSF